MGMRPLTRRVLGDSESRSLIDEELLLTLLICNIVLHWIINF